jgi:hypothetical protein
MKEFLDSGGLLGRCAWLDNPPDLYKSFLLFAAFSRFCADSVSNSGTFCLVSVKEAMG